MCPHTPGCVCAGDRDRPCEARIVADHPGQGWSRLSNGVIVFHDGKYLTPEGLVGEMPVRPA